MIRQWDCDLRVNEDTALPRHGTEYTVKAVGDEGETGAFKCLL
jgi:hypothetical protein